MNYDQFSNLWQTHLMTEFATNDLYKDALFAQFMHESGNGKQTL